MLKGFMPYEFVNNISVNSEPLIFFFTFNLIIFYVDCS
ncbi:hypothetical protein EZS27_001815 [termite gut metagenome]|uniref:Uncharacterized protein n=1 Tax=termite gut metagenome TaxID=433724 RepID=A0A5J4SXV9_9ZZZZ